MGLAEWNAVAGVDPTGGWDGERQDAVPGARWLPTSVRRLVMAVGILGCVGCETAASWVNIKTPKAPGDPVSCAARCCLANASEEKARRECGDMKIEICGLQEVLEGTCAGPGLKANNAQALCVANCIDSNDLLTKEVAQPKSEKR